jgi:hypothetical protein
VLICSCSKKEEAAPKNAKPDPGATKNTDIDGIFLSAVASRNLALENEASYRKFATKNLALKGFYEKAQATSHARVAAVAALVKKP